MRFQLGKPVTGDESRQLEFKTVSSQNPVRAIANACDEYAVAFLNSCGGRILWGIRDGDKVVEGVALNERQRDELRRAVADKLNSIEPKIDPTLFRLEMTRVGDDLFVVSLTVPRSNDGPFFASGKDAFVRLDGVKKLLSGPQLTAWIRERSLQRRHTRRRDTVPIEVYHHGERLPLESEVLWDFRSWRYDRPSVMFDFHLPATASVKRREKFGIVTSSFFTVISDGCSGRHDPIALPDGRHLFTAEKMLLNLAPGGWHKYSFTGQFHEHVVDRREELAFRFFGSGGPVDVPFAVRMLGVDPKVTARNQRLALRELRQLERKAIGKR